MLNPSPDHRPLGESQIIVSPIAWGMWRFQGDDVYAARARVEAALDAGITLFDTADVYGPDNGEAFGSAEALLGRVLAEAGGLRDRMVIATKGGIRPGVPYDSSADYLAEALDASLRRLGVDSIDLWQIHRPDLLSHPEEVARALVKMVECGKVRSLGVSNFSAAQVRALQAHLPIPLVGHQLEFSLLRTEPLWDGTIDQAMETGMAVLAWSPLGGGRLALDLDVSALLDRKASEAGVSHAAVICSWILAHPARPIPILGSQTIARIAEAGDAFKPAWTRREWYEVLQAARGERLP